MASKVDKENLVRSLADRPLLVSSWKCRWNLHVWRKWDYKLQKNLYGDYIQFQTCDSCGFVRSQKIKVGL